MRMLLTGGVKSGKSARAVTCASQWGRPVTFIATAVARDGEIVRRIARHQAERAHLGWTTIEEPIRIDQAIHQVKEAVVVDCITMWLSNLVSPCAAPADLSTAETPESLAKRLDQIEPLFETVMAGFVAELQRKEYAAIVTNETGLGNIPFDPLTRRYNELLAQANRMIAAAVDTVELLVCGMPVQVKGAADGLYH